MHLANTRSGEPCEPSNKEYVKGNAVVRSATRAESSAFNVRLPKEFEMKKDQGICKDQRGQKQSNGLKQQREAVQNQPRSPGESGGE